MKSPSLEVLMLVTSPTRQGIHLLAMVRSANRQRYDRGKDKDEVHSYEYRLQFPHDFVESARKYTVAHDRRKEYGVHDTV